MLAVHDLLLDLQPEGSVRASVVALTHSASCLNSCGPSFAPKQRHP